MKFIKTFLLLIIYLALLNFVFMPISQAIAGNIGTIATIIIALMMIFFTYKALFVIIIKLIKAILLLTIYTLFLAIFLIPIGYLIKGAMGIIIAAMMSFILSFFLYKYLGFIKFIKTLLTILICIVISASVLMPIGYLIKGSMGIVIAGIMALVISIFIYKYLIFIYLKCIKFILGTLIIISFFALIAYFSMIIGYTIAGDMGLNIGFILTVIFSLYNYWNSDKIILKMSNIEIADKKEFKLFYEIVEEQIQKANLPMPKLFIMETEMPNAFATGRNAKNAAIGITTELWKILNKEELSGIIAHELAHIKNKDMLIHSIATAFSQGLLMASKIFVFLRIKPHPIMLIFIIMLAPITGTIMQMALSRKREYDADKLGGEICGNPLYLAKALEKLIASDNEPIEKESKENKTDPTKDKPNIPKSDTDIIDIIFSTHPDTNKRIKRLQNQATSLNKV